MKIDYTQTKVHTNVSAPAIALGIDMAGMNHVMSILSNLYSDPYLAVLREYTTNARDSHIAAGNRAPIEVTSPTDEFPQLTIIDHGLGLGRDDLIDTYSRYGSSTKRDSNEQVGAFGIGSKSAFTISTQFTVTGIKDGCKTVVLFSISEDQTPILQVLDESDTTEPNGVTIAVPVEDVATMRKTILRFFFTWPVGSVLVDGLVPPSLYVDASVIQVAPDKFLRKVDPKTPTYSRQSSLKIVMGSVAYEASNYGLPEVHAGATAYIEVPIGAVDIAPSRETLKDTERTREFVTQAIADFNQAVEATEQAAIAKIGPDKAKAARAMTEWGEFRGLDDHRQWARHAKKWGLESIEPEQHPELPIKRPIHPWNIDRLMLVTGIDTERKVNLFYKRDARWRQHYHQDEPTMVPVAAATTEGDVEWLSWGKGKATRTLSYKVWKQEAMVLYRKTTYSGATAGIRYNIKIGQRPSCDEDLAVVLAACQGRKILLLDNRHSFLHFLDDTYVQIALNNRQARGTAIKRLGSPKLEDREALIQAERDKNTRNLTQEEKEVIAAGKVAHGDFSLRQAVQLLNVVGVDTVTNSRLQELVKKVSAFEALPADKRDLPVPAEVTEAAQSEFAWVKTAFPLLPYVRWSSWKPEKHVVNAVRSYVNA